MIENASIIRQKRQTVKITIEKDGSLTVYSPYGVSYETLSKIVRDKTPLLQKKLNYVREIDKKYQNIISYKKIMLFGREYTVAFAPNVKKTAFSDDYFLITDKIPVNKVPLIIKKALRETAERVLPKRMREILDRLDDFAITKIVIGDFKAKWGSCDTNGVIKLNWRLVMLNQNLIDFVLLHELTHTREMNHSKKFYNVLSTLDENWKPHRKQLGEYSFLLKLY